MPASLVVTDTSGLKLTGEVNAGLPSFVPDEFGSRIATAIDLEKNQSIHGWDNQAIQWLEGRIHHYNKVLGFNLKFEFLVPEPNLKRDETRLDIGIYRDTIYIPLTPDFTPAVLGSYIDWVLTHEPMHAHQRNLFKLGSRSLKSAIRAESNLNEILRGVIDLDHNLSIPPMGVVRRLLPEETHRDAAVALLDLHADSRFFRSQGVLLPEPNKGESDHGMTNRARFLSQVVRHCIYQLAAIEAIDASDGDFPYVRALKGDLPHIARFHACTYVVPLLAKFASKEEISAVRAHVYAQGEIFASNIYTESFGWSLKQYADRSFNSLETGFRHAVKGILDQPSLWNLYRRLVPVFRDFLLLSCNFQDSSERLRFYRVSLKDPHDHQMRASAARHMANCDNFPALLTVKGALRSEPDGVVIEELITTAKQIARNYPLQVFDVFNPLIEQKKSEFYPQLACALRGIARHVYGSRSISDEERSAFQKSAFRFLSCLMASEQKGVNLTHLSFNPRRVYCSLADSDPKLAKEIIRCYAVLGAFDLEVACIHLLAAFRDAPECKDEVASAVMGMASILRLDRHLARDRSGRFSADDKVASFIVSALIGELLGSDDPRYHLAGFRLVDTTFRDHRSETFYYRSRLRAILLRYLDSKVDESHHRIATRLINALVVPTDYRGLAVPSASWSNDTNLGSTDQSSLGRNCESASLEVSRWKTEEILNALKHIKDNLIVSSVVDRPPDIFPEGSAIKLQFLKEALDNRNSKIRVLVGRAALTLALDSHLHTAEFLGIYKVLLDDRSPLVRIHLANWLVKTVGSLDLKPELKRMLADRFFLPALKRRGAGTFSPDVANVFISQRVSSIPFLDLTAELRNEVAALDANVAQFDQATRYNLQDPHWWDRGLDFGSLPNAARVEEVRKAILSKNPKIALSAIKRVASLKDFGSFDHLYQASKTSKHPEVKKLALQVSQTLLDNFPKDLLY